MSRACLAVFLAERASGVHSDEAHVECLRSTIALFGIELHALGLFKIAVAGATCRWRSAAVRAGRPRSHGPRSDGTGSFPE